MYAKNILRGQRVNSRKKSFSEIVLGSLHNGGSKIAMVEGESGKTATYEEILQRSISLAQHLSRMGIQRNDTIVICMENSLHFPVLVFAAFYLGAVVNPTNVFYKQRELLHLLNISKPKLIFCSKTSLETIQLCAKQLNYDVEYIILIDECKTAPGSVLKFQDFIQLPFSNSFQATPVNREDAALILCSSGSTGFPKAVLLSNAALMSTIEYFAHPKLLNFSSEINMLITLPFFHSYGFHICINAIISHTKMIVLKKFKENIFLKCIQDYKVNFVPCVPPIINFLHKSPLIEKYDLSSFKYCTCAGASLSSDLQKSVMKRLNIQILQCFGLTECTFLTLMTTCNSNKNCTVGVPVPGIECKIYDPDSGHALGPNKRGEICFRGPMVMTGYVGNQRETNEAIDQEGWLHTGDLGYYDEDKYFYIVGRYKEIIKFKGFQVSPQELDSLLLTHPDIIDCGVVGKPHDKYGEVPVAFIVRGPNAKILQKDVIDFVEENISYHKRLHGGVVFTNEIPKTALGKVCRAKLRDQLKTLKPEF